MKTLFHNVRKLFNFSTLQVMIGLSSCLFTTAIFANPVLNNVEAGNVTVQQTGNSTVVNQSSQKAILNWNSFNIGAGESTHFQQPAGGAALNRINPTQGASQIYGSLTATGQIILMNPAGIHFGPGAYVSVGSLIATTGNMTSQDFLNGNYRITNAGAYNGSIINEGQIIAAQHGLVALVAPNVVNKGLIQANAGQVVLASGNAFTLSFDGNNLIHFSVDEKATTNERGVTQTNTGALIADGGKVLVTAKAAQNVLDKVINMEGVVQARSVSQTQTGEIIFSGDTDSGVVRLAAKVDASGENAGEKGGTVKTTGYNILVDSTADINVSGSAGGGDVYIGGNYQGKGPLPNANATVMLAGAKINANAIDNGNGGNVILWADDVTRAYGNISVQGGALGGNGGFIETSGKHYLDVAGISVNTLAANGERGTWLLDPSDLTISNAASSNVTPTNPFTADANSTTSTLNVTDLTNALASANVTVETTSGGTGGGQGNITVAVPISWSAATTLTLTAFNRLFLNADITNTNGGLTLNAANSAQSITSGTSGSPSATGVTANINVANFNVQTGHWYQLNSTLPTFTVSNNFQIQGGAINSTTASFLRALSGSGTSGSPYVLTDVYGLQGAASLRTNSFNLNNNIDASVTSNWNSTAGFVPIGNITSQFTGNFNGQNFTIDNLHMDWSNEDGVGLFGWTQNGTIQNLGVTNVDIVGGTHIGAIAGWTSGGAFSNVYATGTVDIAGVIGDVSTGGLIGYQASTLTNGWSGVNVTTSAAGTGTYVGGLVGYQEASITNSYATGNVTGFDSVGGLVGYANSGNLTNTFSTGAVTGTVGSSNLGGLVGATSGAVTASNNYWNTVTSGQASSAIGTAVTSVANMMTQSTFSGFDFTSTWNIIANQSFPYLRSIYSTTPRAISGTSSATTGTVATLAANGSIIDTVQAYANGFYYFLEGNGVIADSDNILVYMGSSGGNAVYIAPTSGGSLSGSTALNLTANTLQIGGSSAGTYNTTILNSAKGALADANILYSISGSALNLSNNVNLVTGSGTTYEIASSLSGASTNSSLTFNGALSLQAALIELSGVNINLLGNISGTGSSILNIINSDTSTISGAIQNTVTNVNKSGAGTLTLSNTGNAFTGSMAIFAGELRLGASDVIPDTVSLALANTAGVAFNLNGFSETIGNLLGGGGTGGNTSLGAGTLTLGDSSNNTYSGVISGTGSLIKQGTGRQTLSGVNTYTGSTTINNGTLQLGIANALNADTALTVNASGIFDLNGNNVTVDSLSGAGNITLGSGTLTNNTSATTTYSGIMSGTGGFTLSGTGDLTFSGANTYDGTTTISGGTLRAANAAALGSTAGGTIVNAGATLLLSNVAIGAEALTLNGTGAGSVGALRGTGTSSYAGAVTLGSASTIGTSAGTLTLSGGISGGFDLTTIGPGSLILTNSAAVGDIAVNAGILQMGGANLITNSTTDITVASSAIFDLNDFDTSIGSLAGQGNVSIGSATLTLANNNSTSYTGTLSGTGTVDKDGSGTFSVGSAIATTGGFNLNAGTLQLTANNVITNDTNLTIAAGATFDLNNFSTTIGALSGAGDVTLGSGTLSSTSSSTTTFSGIMSGAGGFTLNGTGDLTFSGANTYDGTTTINGGTLRAQNSTALGSTVGGTIVASGATLFMNTGSIGAEALQLSGSGAGGIGALTGSGTYGGNITLNAATTFGSTGILRLNGTVTGGYDVTKVNGNTLQIGNTFNVGNILLDRGVLQLMTSNVIPDTSIISFAQSATGVAIFNLSSNSDTIGGLVASSTTLASINIGSGTLTVNQSGNSTFNGLIQGTGGSFVKSGAGTLTLGRASTYTGSTTISGGTIALGVNNAIPTATTLLGSGTLDLNGFSQQVGSIDGSTNTITNSSGTTGTFTLNNSASNTFTGNLTGNLNFTKTGAGVLIFNPNTSTYTGTTTINNGTLRLANANILPDSSAITLANVATAILDLNGNNETIASLAGGGATGGNVTLGAGTLTVGDANNTTYAGIISGTGGFTKQGSGTLTLSGVNTYSGVTTINAGTLQLGTSGVISDSSAIVLANTAGAALDLNGNNETIASLAGGGATGGNISLGSGTLTIGDASNTSYAGIISGTGGLIKQGSGTLTLSGANAYNGGTTINAGILAAQNNAALGTSTATVANGASLQVEDGITLSNALSLIGTGTATQGALVANGTATVSGAITLAGNATIGTTNNTDTFTLGTINGGNALTLAGLGIIQMNGAIGGSTALSSLTANSRVNLNGIIVTTTGNQTYNDSITLAATSALTSNAGSLALDTITGNFGLTLSSNTGTTFNDTVNIGSLTTAGSGTDTINTASITTTGNQTYGKALALGTDTVLTAQGSGAASTSTISLLNGVTGNQDLTLAGGNSGTFNFTLGGTLGLDNVSVQGNGGTNTFTLSTADTQSWTITGSNAANVTGIAGVTGTFNTTGIQNLVSGSGNDSFSLSGGTLSGSINGSTGTNSLTGDNVANTWTVDGTNTGTVTGIGGTYSNIQNLIGGNSGNTFTFAAGASISNINGSNLTQTNTINYAAFGKVNITLSDTNDGTTRNAASSLVNNFSNITNLIADLTDENSITLPNNAKSNDLVITNAAVGYINDPIYFNGFNYFISSTGSDGLSVPAGATINYANNSVTYNGVTMYFTNFGNFFIAPNNTTTTTTTTTTNTSVIPNVSTVMQQASTDNEENINVDPTSDGTYIMDTVSNNMDQLIKDIATQFDKSIDNIKINPYCTSTGTGN